MATIQTITDDLGKPLDIINIDSSIGTNGVNYFGDIQAVKALFQFVPRYSYTKASGSGRSLVETGMGKEASWHLSRNLLPSPYDGTIWGVAELTRSFQKYANSKLSAYGYKVNVNGTIKPAKGYAVVGKNFSTIAALNIFAALGVNGNKSTVETIINNYQDIFRNISDDR